MVLLKSLPNPAPITRDELTPAEKTALAQWAENPVTHLALRVIESTRPDVFVNRNATNDDKIGRLQNLQGWEMYRAALLTVGIEVQPVEDLEEDFETNDFSYQPEID